MQQAILGKQADICLPPLSSLNESVDIFVRPNLKHTELLARITHNLTECVPPVLQLFSQNSLFFILSHTQYASYAFYKDGDMFLGR